VSLAELRLVNAINLCDRDVLALESGSSFLVVGSEVLAVTAPMMRIRKLEHITL
jgi:hypothetical protein